MKSLKSTHPLLDLYVYQVVVYFLKIIYLFDKSLYRCFLYYIFFVLLYFCLFLLISCVVFHMWLYKYNFFLLFVTTKNNFFCQNNSQKTQCVGWCMNFMSCVYLVSCKIFVVINNDRYFRIRVWCILINIYFMFFMAIHIFICRTNEYCIFSDIDKLK